MISKTLKRLPVLLLLGLALAGCGGRGGKPPLTPIPPPVPAEVQVAISSPAVNVDLGRGDLFRATLAGTWTGRNLGSAQVYLQVNDSGNTFVLPDVQLAPAGGSFSHSLPVLTTVGAGPRTGSLAVRACRDAACAQPYEGASASLAYQLRVTAVPEWETYQGNAAHTGYVPITLDPTRFVTAWSWTTSGAAPQVESIVTSPSRAHALVTQTYLDAYPSVSQRFFAFDAASGAVSWTNFVGSYFGRSRDPSLYVGYPAIGHGRLYHQIRYERSPFCMGPPELCNLDQGSEVRSLALSDGLAIMNSQWRPYGTSNTAPVPFGDFVYVQGAKSMRAYNRDGAVHWEVTNEEPYARAAPAVDETRVYTVTSQSESQLSAGNLQILDRATGAPLASIAHPATPGVSGGVAPVLGGRGNVMVHVACLQDTRFTCQLASLHIATRAWAWTTTARYLAAPAVANGVVYARRDSSPMTVDAIDEATGAVLWSRPLPTGTKISAGLPNMIVTRNILFVGSDVVTYAMELESGRIAYELPRAGVLALSADRMLYLGRRDRNGSSDLPSGLVAVRLQ